MKSKSFNFFSVLCPAERWQNFKEFGYPSLWPYSQLQALSSVTWTKSGELVLHPHNLEELASLSVSRRSQSGSNKPVLPHCMQVWLVRMQADCTASLQLYSTQRSPKVTPNPPGHNLSSTMFKGVYSKSSTTGAADVVHHTVRTSRMRWLRGGCTILTWSYKACRAAPRCSARQAGAVQAFQSAFSSELKNPFCQVTKEKWLLWQV